jgi:hypothetical protein
MKTTVVNVSEPHDVYIARPSKWGNPFMVGPDGDRAEVLRKYEERLKMMPSLVADARRELRGKRLACWCKSHQDCHGHILARYADG